MIERIQVEEGYLRKLDITFSAGLNVLIGPRGVGKTSVVELIRFCLGLDAFTEEAGVEARKHALSVLGPGQVTLTVEHLGQRFLVSRTAEEDQPRFSGDLPPVVVIAQNEIEAIGLSATGRLRLLDQFLKADAAANEIPSTRARLKSTTSQIASIARDLAAARDQEARLAGSPDELRQAEKELALVLSSVAASDAQRAGLEELSSESARLAVRNDLLDRATDAIDQWLARVEDLRSRVPTLDEWPKTDQKPDMLAGSRKALVNAADALDQTARQLSAELKQLEATRHEVTASRLALEDRSRALRVVLDELQEGSGVLTKKVATLRELVAQLVAIRDRSSATKSRLDEAKMRRRGLFKELQEARTKRFDRRKAVAKSLNDELGPAIQVTVDGGSAIGGYEKAVLAALQGSGLHYSTLSPALASAMNPLELAEAAESLDVDRVAKAADIPRDRAFKSLQYLAQHGLEDIVAAPIDDSVSLSLLDGAEYKPAGSLSTGQRCTVVLPILLAASNRTLVVDQPEDHLDNAFITATLIKALRARGDDSQYVFSTHNANIPVLGGADRVFVLGSDGKRGFVDKFGELNDIPIIESITKVMEGGLEAFHARAAYYERLSKPTA